MNIKEEIRKLIEKAIKSFGSYDGPVLVETPKEKTHGDYSTNIALALAKKLNKNPIEVAGGLVKELSSKVLKNIGIEKVEVAGPGFINFYLSKKFFVENLKKINKNFGKNSNLKDQKVIVEYTDPNPFKEFHIGHLMSNSIGESISRIFEFQGAKVKRANYQGDVGLHVAKAIWGKMQNQNQAWQNAYVFGSEKYEINETAKKESLEYFEKIYKTLGTKFDYYFFESAVADFGKKIVENGLKSGIFEKGEKGATIFKGEKTGLHTRVFINSEGLPTYEAKELGLAHIKYKKYGYNQSVIITGNEINEYFKVLLSAMLQIFPELAEKTKHIGHGMMRLSEGKMSSRTGKIITFEFLLNKVEELVKEKIKDRDLSDLEKKEITEKVAIGALKYSILKQSIGSDIIYDFKKSISFEGDSGPYLQYSYARAQSVLKKAKAEKIKASLKNIPNEISKLEKDMIYFPEIVEKSGKEYEPHVITLYLTELAREFNNYYANNKIVDKNDDFSSYKVAITEAFSIIMKNSLWLLGIQAPEKM